MSKTVKPYDPAEPCAKCGQRDRVVRFIEAAAVCAHGFNWQAPAQLLVACQGCGHTEWRAPRDRAA